MSIQAINNQPIQFDVNPSACSVAQYQYIQIVDTNDVSQIQFEIQPCLTADNLIQNGAFSSSTGWVTTDSFSIDTIDNVARKAAGGIGTLNQYNVCQNGAYYQLRIVIGEINETMQVWNGVQQLGNVKGVGEYVFSFRANGDSISIRSFSATNAAEVTSVSVYELDDRLLVGIFDEAGTYQNAITLADDPEYFRLAEDRLTVLIDWSALSIGAGCYYLGIADPCINTNGQNGNTDPTLANSSLWTETIGANATLTWLTGGAILYSATDFSPNGTITIEDQNIVYEAGTSYDIEIDVAATSTSLVVKAHVGTANDTSGTITSPQTVSFTIVAAGATPYFKLELYPNAIPLTRAVISGIRVKLANLSDMTPDSQSVDLKVGTFDCSVLLNMNSNENSLGFEFDQSRFSPLLRLEGELVNPTYPTQRTVIPDTRGNMNVIFGERMKARLLRIDLQPEYILDFLSLLPVCDNLWIDGVKYHVQEDEISPEYPDAIVDTGKVTINVIEEGQALINRNTTGTQNDSHFLVDEYIVDPQLDNTIITEADGTDTVQAL